MFVSSRTVNQKRTQTSQILLQSCSQSETLSTMHPFLAYPPRRMTNRSLLRFFWHLVMFDALPLHLYSLMCPISFAIRGNDYAFVVPDVQLTGMRELLEELSDIPSYTTHGHVVFQLWRSWFQESGRDMRVLSHLTPCTCIEQRLVPHHKSL